MDGASLAVASISRVDLADILIAILKEKSPSCGVNVIYDGSFSGQHIKGEGVVTTFLRQHGLQVFSEHQIDAARKALAKR